MAGAASSLLMKISGRVNSIARLSRSVATRWNANGPPPGPLPLTHGQNRSCDGPPTTGSMILAGVDVGSIRSGVTLVVIRTR